MLTFFILLGPDLFNFNAHPTSFVLFFFAAGLFMLFFPISICMVCGMTIHQIRKTRREIMAMDPPPTASVWAEEDAPKNITPAALKVLTNLYDLFSKK
jgi:hypothetical protein